MTTIITKNEGTGDGTEVPVTLAKGELAVNTKSFVLYVGDDAGTPTPVAGGGGSTTPGTTQGDALYWDTASEKWLPTASLELGPGTDVTVSTNLNVVGAVGAFGGFDGALRGSATQVGGYSVVVDSGAPSGTDPNTIYFVT